MRACITTLLALSVFAQIARGQDEIVLKTHQLLHGQVVESTPDSVTFHHVVDGKAKEMTFSADQLEPVSFYVIRKDVLGDDAQAHIVLGQFCMENGMQTRARNQFIEARKLDPSLKSKVDALMLQSKEQAGKQLVSEADALQKAGHVDGAWKKSVQAVRLYGDTAAGKQARGMVQQLHTEKQQVPVARAAEASANEAADELKGVHRVLHEAAELNTKGLTAKNQSESLREFEGSAKKYQSALKSLQKMSDSKPAASLAQQTVSDLVEVYLNAGHVYLVRTDYQNALAEANKAIAVAPKASRAQSFRAQVGAASSDDDYGDYVPWERIRRRPVHRRR